MGIKGQCDERMVINSKMKNEPKMALGLQFFAEDGGESGEGAELSALLAGDTALQSQFDRLVNKALKTAHGNWEQERSDALAQAGGQQATEAERRLAQREQTLAQRELRADAATLLGERELPAELLDCVNLQGAEEMRKSVERMEGAFRASVDRAVESRLRGATPKGGGTGGAYDAQMRRAMGLK
ncbi:MAG: DUF4355 domain-containing protein [Clostridia bacterium]